MSKEDRREIAQWRGNDTIGRRVRSHYAARWTGIVVALEHRVDGGVLVTCKVTHDSCGNPLRKPITHSYGSGWLTLL